ncbi:MAG TPA: ATP-binding protein [Anaerolineales bacterium]|jgi:two-component system phosphate regulon sensor histidine kinase PhoR
MNNYLLAALVLVVLALAWVSWRHVRLRRQLNKYTHSLEMAFKDELSPGQLPTDLKDLEQLSNSVYSAIRNYENRLDALDAERARLEATLTQMTDGVLIADSQGRIQMTNPAADNLFSEGEPLAGKTVSVALRHHQLIETWRKCQQNREVQSDSVELPTARKFVQLIAIPDEHGGGAILLVQDLTRIRRLETVRRDFISNVSHELRTPLASLKALTETLQEGALEDPPAAHRFLGRIQTEVDALTQMATELLELSRIESGQVPLERKPIQPAVLLISAADRMKMQAERAGVSLLVDPTASLPTIRADLPRLEQVLVNLIHNAIKFTPPGGEVDLKAVQVGNSVRFSVHDTGTGIPSDDLPRIFERFYRVDRSRSGGGTGLGLSIARHLVEAHMGKIWAESREGEGSTFYFTIPAG